MKAVGAAVLTAALVTGGAVAVNASGGGDENNPAPSGTAVRAAASDTGETEVYTGITPCRILDTRSSTPITSGTRNFDVSGALASQGGSGSCGIPTNATSVSVNLTGISNGGSTGYVRGWAAGDSPVNATLLNFSPALNASNLVTIPLCQGGPCPDAFTLQVFGSADIVGDAVGYYQAPMYASISTSGSVQYGSSGVVSATKVSTGRYDITFDRSVQGCAGVASAFNWASSNEVSVDTNDNGAGVVSVGIVNESEAFEDASFALTVTC